MPLITYWVMVRIKARFDMPTTEPRQKINSKRQESTHSVVVDDQWNEGYLAAKSSRTYIKKHTSVKLCTTVVYICVSVCTIC